MFSPVLGDSSNGGFCCLMVPLLLLLLKEDDDDDELTFLWMVDELEEEEDEDDDDVPECISNRDSARVICVYKIMVQGCGRDNNISVCWCGSWCCVIVMR